MKKRPAKKAPKPKRNQKEEKPKRKYTPRGTKSVVGGGTSDNGIALLTIEKYETVAGNGAAFRWSAEYRKMEQLLKNLKVKEGFLIETDWKNWPHKIVKELELGFVISIQKIAGNEAVRRVVRLK